ncbi:MAG TPA: RidA family protein [Thermoflexales bacterium]|jgi:2-iminobutanoate/2-iminopropanoate deaminase|nr:RidA family protein [Anaerolineae bacterium]HQV28139.1 RidA family protein [Thermoflexales bacterium]HQX10067.1 RidA family protein [Thermoflexales bacterium]HQY24102.1 RidA family protein [Thermoflexales bacterium]HQZ53516.1 RidA family protein [Thermoflexales bacterium]
MSTRIQVRTEAAPQAIGPYSQAIVAPGFVFCSGQIPLDPATGNVVEGGIDEQTHRVLKNLTAVVEAAGASMAKVLKTTVFLQSMSDFAAMNAIYATYFPAPAPARSTVEVARLPRNVLVEIECIALA